MPQKTCHLVLRHDTHTCIQVEVVYGAPFVKILHLTDLEITSLHAEIAIYAQR